LNSIVESFVLLQVLEKTFASGEMFEEPDFSQKQMQWQEH